MSNTQGSFDAQFEVDLHDPHTEQYWANRDQNTNTHGAPSEQVRIEFHTAPDTILGAVFTVSPSFLSEEKRVILGSRIKNLDICQLSGNVCEGEVKAQTMIEGLDEEPAKA